MLKSLQLRITLIAVVFAVLLAATLTAAGGLVVHQQLLDSMGARARLAVAELHAQLDRLVQLGLPPENVTGFDAQCQSLLNRDSNLEFAGVFDVYGRRLFGAGQQKHAWPQDLRDTPLSDGSSPRALVAVQSVHSRDGRVLAYVVVSVSEDAIRDATWRNVRYFMLVAILLILLSLALHQIFLARMVARPVRELIDAIDSIDPDDPQTASLALRAGEDDLGRLANSFSKLLIRLGDARRALLTQNRRLESAVQERTRQLQEVNAALAEDIERRKRLEEELRELASTDPLTGLANRAFLMPYLGRRLDHARRQQRKLAVVLFDLDGFKPVNDGYGHAVGDLALQAVAQRLRESSRQSDILVRVGGDEFVVVLEGFEDRSQIEAYGRKLMAVFGEPFRLGETVVALGASAGIAVFPDDAADVSGLLAQADHAMYRAKATGGGFSFVTDLAAKDDGAA